MGETNLSIITLPGLPIRLDDYVERGRKFLEAATDLTITDDASETLAVDMTAQAATLRNEAESKRAGLVKPPNEWVKGVNETFRTTIAPVVTGETMLRKKITDWREQKRRRQAEAEAAAEAERLKSEALLAQAEKMEQAGQGDVAAKLLEGAVQSETRAAVAEVQAAPVVNTVRAASGSVSGAMVWTFEITDPAAVPRAYLMIDEAKIRVAVRTGEREIPGIRIFQQEQLRVGRRA